MKIEDLVAYGANVDEGLSRCLGKEDFYLRLVDTLRNDDGFDKLADTIAAKDYKTAFEIAHSLKGSLGNLAITPLYEPVCEITELLRSESDVDYSALLETVSTEAAKLKAL